MWTNVALGAASQSAGQGRASCDLATGLPAGVSGARRTSNTGSPPSSVSAKSGRSGVAIPQTLNRPLSPSSVTAVPLSRLNSTKPPETKLSRAKSAMPRSVHPLRSASSACAVQLDEANPSSDSAETTTSEAFSSLCTRETMASRSPRRLSTQSRRPDAASKPMHTPHDVSANTLPPAATSSATWLPSATDPTSSSPQRWNRLKRWSRTRARAPPPSARSSRERRSRSMHVQRAEEERRCEKRDRVNATRSTRSDDAPSPRSRHGACALRSRARCGVPCRLLDGAAYGRGGKAGGGAADAGRR